MVGSIDATSAPLYVTGSLQIHTPPPPGDETQAGGLSDPENDLSSLKGREAFWQHLLDRFKLLQWEHDRQRAEFHLLDAELNIDALTSRQEPGLNAEEAASMASCIAGGSGSDAPDLSSLVIDLDNATAAVLLADD